MSILSALGLGKKVRYAVVGLGDISQEAMLPGIAHTGNSELVALVTGDAEKAEGVGKQYGVAAHHSYDEFGAMIRSGTVDAIYLATPNWRHAEFAVPALEAGIHVLVEKPLEVTLEKCRAIIAAAETGRAKLMVAYRLHFEPATLAAVDRVRSGDFGELILFSSVFTQMVAPENHRAHSGEEAGPVFDMGPYPINACRMMFEDEPVEVVSAVATRHPQAGFGDVDDTVAATLRFPGDRLAHFVVSYYGNRVDTFTVVGTKGSLKLDPCFMYGMPLQHEETIGESKSTTSFKSTDHFGGEMKYFSQCILDDAEVEPDGEEGYADVRVILGILEAVRTGGPVKLEPFTRTKRIDTRRQKETLSPKSPPELVKASNPSRDKDASPKN